jgi:putative endonuclease
MNFYTYVIYSKKFNRFYKGHCQDLNDRLKQHNQGQTRSTRPFIPWELIWHETFNTRKEAIKREKYLKTAAGRRFLKKFIPF